MGRDDWCRKTTWTADDQKAFFDKLSRAKKFSAPQYARIQAYYLANVGTRELGEAALDLLDMVIERWPETFDIECVYYQRAMCLIRLRRGEEAVQAFRDALRVSKENPHHSTDAALDFGMLAVCYGRKDLYEEVVEALSSRQTLAFPAQRYKYSAVMAIIADSARRREDARRFAQAALQAAAMTDSGFRYHGKLGLVDKPEARIHKKVQRLAR